MPLLTLLSASPRNLAAPRPQTQRRRHRPRAYPRKRGNRAGRLRLGDRDPDSGL